MNLILAPREIRLGHPLKSTVLWGNVSVYDSATQAAPVLQAPSENSPAKPLQHKLHSCSAHSQKRFQPQFFFLFIIFIQRMSVPITFLQKCQGFEDVWLVWEAQWQFQSCLDFFHVLRRLKQVQLNITRHIVYIFLARICFSWICQASIFVMHFVCSSCSKNCRSRANSYSRILTGCK